MQERMYIESPSNPRIKALGRLQNRRHRRQEGLLLVEGLAEFSLAWAAGLAPRGVYLCPEFLKPEGSPEAREEQRLISELESAHVPIVEVSQQVMRKLAYREHPDAWICAAESPRLSLTDFEARTRGVQAPLVVIAEDLEKPGNLGAILRSLDAVAATGLISAQGRTDLLNPNVVRSSKGCLFTIPLAEADNQQSLEYARRAGLQIVAASPEASISLWELDLTKPTAFVVGAEKEGLSDFWKTRADFLVNIPMGGRVNSLNVAQAATLLLYEALRQRTNHPSRG